MSTLNTAAAWQADVTDSAKVGLLALADCVAGPPDETSTFVYDTIPAVAAMTGWTEGMVEDFLVALSLGTKGDMGGGRWLKFATVIATAEAVFPR